MSARQDLVDQIIRHEGLRLKPYEDSFGNLTIGVGRNLTANGISNKEAMQLLDHDLDEAVADLAMFPWFLELDAVRQRVLVDLRFNLGPTRLRTFTRLLKALAVKDYQKASVSMRESAWFSQVKHRGVELVQMMQTGADV